MPAGVIPAAERTVKLDEVMPGGCATVRQWDMRCR